MLLVVVMLHSLSFKVCYSILKSLGSCLSFLIVVCLGVADVRVLMSTTLVRLE
jgi:hypothetical protein